MTDTERVSPHIARVKQQLKEAQASCQELSLALAGLSMEAARTDRQLKASVLVNGHLREAIEDIAQERDSLARRLAVRFEAQTAATRLLEFALHLRMHGENAPGGTETWAQFDRDVEAFLRAQPPEASHETSYPRVQVPENTGKHPEEPGEILTITPSDVYCHCPACVDYGSPDFGEGTCPADHAEPCTCKPR